MQSKSGLKQGITRDKNYMKVNDLISLTTFLLVLVLLLVFEGNKKLPLNVMTYSVGGLIVGGIIQNIYFYRFTEGKSSHKKAKIVGRLLLVNGLIVGFLMGMSGMFPSALK